jgi:hypothetical protein
MRTTTLTRICEHRMATDTDVEPVIVITTRPSRRASRVPRKTAGGRESEALWVSDPPPVRRLPLQLSLFDLPIICCSCSRLQTHNGKWTRHAVLAEDYPNTDFSHGICPSCLRRLYPEAIEPRPARRRPSI